MARWGLEPRVLLKILPDRSGQWLPVPRQGRWVRLLRLHPWDQWPPQPRWDRSALPHPQARQLQQGQSLRSGRLPRSARGAPAVRRVPEARSRRWDRLGQWGLPCLWAQ